MITTDGCKISDDRDVGYALQNILTKNAEVQNVFNA